jgi:hypothetical protein
MKDKLLALYGLKFHPFRPDVPIEALYPTHPFQRVRPFIQGTRDREAQGIAGIGCSTGSDSVLVRRLCPQSRQQLLFRAPSPTPLPPTSIANLTDFADLLHQAAETIRSGRLERFTAEWRENMAQVCELAAEAVRHHLEGSDKDSGRGDPR